MSSAGLLDGRCQRPGVGAVAVGAVERDIAGLRRVGDQRALGRAHLGEAAVGGPQAARAKRIVTAGIEDHHVEPGARTLHLAQHEVDVHHLKIDVGLARGIGGDRNQVIRAGDLDAVAGVIEQRDVGALNLPAERLHRQIHRRLVEIELGTAADQREAEGGECLGHQRRIVAGIVEPGHVLIGGVADYQRDALFGGGRRSEDQRDQERQRRIPPVTVKSPAHPQ